MTDVQWLLDQLPPCQPIERRTEADFYGASNLISTALGLDETPPSCASWKHGVTLGQDWTYPELMLTEGNRATRHLVGTGVMALQLKRRGYLRVHAVGAPYLYVEPHAVQRVPCTLLVMPAHSLVNTSHPFDEDAYASQLHSIRDRFDAMVACISAPCVRKASWTKAFEKRGIPWIAGADSSDRNALRRMAAIFGSFEFVTTNTLGSHVAYAAYSGCRVSIWGPYAEYRLEDFRGVPWYEKHWHKLGDLFDQLSEAHVRRKVPWLFKDPWEADPAKSWAEALLGLPHRRDPREVARLLGWTPIGQAEVLVHRAARRLAAIGRRAAQASRVAARGTGGA